MQKTSQIQLIDSHIHLDFSAFDVDRDHLINNAKAAGIYQFVLPAAQRKAWQKIALFCQAYPEILPAYGIHPYFINTHKLSDCDALHDWIDHNPCLAIGETGLDFNKEALPHTLQIRYFKAQLQIAKDRKLPVILHANKAVEAVIDGLKKLGIEKGIVHSFNGSYVQAMRLIDMGFILGFGGAITYPRAKRLRALIKELPLSGICLETDAPDQPSSSFSGKRNEPTALIDVLETIAQLRDIDTKELALRTTQNTRFALNIRP